MLEEAIKEIVKGIKINDFIIYAKKSQKVGFWKRKT